MAYAQDTITSANAANDFVNVLDGLLLSAGWTIVETLTPSGNFRNRVYLSSGASNLCGYDWYLLVSWTTIGTENFVQVIGAEEYNAGTHIATGLCGAPFGDTPTSGSGYKSSQPTTGFLSTTTRNMSTFTVSTTPTTISSNEGSSSSQNNTTTPGFQTLLPSSAFAYWASVTLDHVALWTTVATNFESAVVASVVLDAGYEGNPLFNDKMLVCWSSGSSTNGGNFQASSHFIGVALGTTTYLAAAVTFSGVYGAKLPALTDTYLDAFAWMPYIYLSYMTQGSANPTPGTQIAGQIVVGRVADFLMVWGGSMGDTVEVDAATYVLTGPMLNAWGSTLRPTLALLVE
jgi:hypothetical protein